MTILGYDVLTLISYSIFPTIVVAFVHFYRKHLEKNYYEINGDPIKIADDYIAYGRKLQAIEVLEKAKLEFPKNNEIIKKLNQLGVEPYKAPSSGLQKVFNFIIGIVVFFLGLAMIDKGWDYYNLDKEFRVSGIKTTATFAGYKYHEKVTSRGKSGDLPLLTYTASNGVRYEHLGRDYGVVSDKDKKILPNQKIIITYLPTKPELARVDNWQYPNKQYVLLIFGIFFSVMGIIFPFKK
jgi:hypothetical protein